MYLATSASFARWVVVVVAVSCVSQAAAPESAAAHQQERHNRVSIRAVTLSSKDVSAIYGAGFYLSTDRIMSNNELTSVNQATGGTPSAPGSSDRDRVTGFVSTWVRRDKSGTMGLENLLSEYKNASGLRASFHKMAKQFKPGHTTTTGLPGRLKISISWFTGVGDGALLSTTQVATVTVLSIIFIRGRFSVGVAANMLTSLFPV